MTLRKIDGFVVDGILEEEVRYETVVTDYPIESGGKASDHIENATPVVSMTFIVSDTPIGEVAKQRSADTIPSNERSGTCSSCARRAGRSRSRVSPARTR